MSEYLDPKATSIQPSIPLQASHSAPTALSFRANFSWTFVGNVIYAVCQWGMLIALAKLGSPSMVGRFALGLSVTAPIFMLTNLQLRDVQATDAAQEYLFGDYLALRLLTTALALLSIVGLGLLTGYSSETLLVIFAVGVAKACESFSDIFYGRLQQHERMDRIAKSLIVRGLLSLIVLSSVIALTGSIVWGTVALACSWAVVLIAYDARGGRVLLRSSSQLHSSVSDPGRVGWNVRWEPKKIIRLMWMTFPLGLVMMLVSLNTNVPRYFLERYLDEHALGIFAAIAYLQVAGTTVVSALAGSAIPLLAKHYASADWLALRKLLVKLVGIALLLGIGGCLIALIGGSEILTLIYGPDYGAETSLLFWVMVTAMIGYVSWFLGDALTAIRCINLQVPLFVVTVISTTISCSWLIPSFGLLGAAAAMVIGSLVRMVGSLTILGYTLHNRQTLVGGAVNYD